MPGPQNITALTFGYVCSKCGLVGTSRLSALGACLLGALLRGTFMPTQIEGTVDDANMTVRLRKVTQHAPAQRVELLSEQTDVIAA